MAAGGSRTVRVRFDGDATGLRNAAQQGGDAVEGWRDKFQRFNRAAVTASLGVVAAAGSVGKQLYDLAADAEQSIGAVDSVFKGNSGQVKAWARNAATSVGLSANAYRESATLIGAQLKNMGVPMDEVAGKTDGMITKAADLASMFGGTTKEAVDALSSALKGERDPIERYGISLNQASIDAKKAELGLDGLSGAADRQADATATMALIQEQSADATGNFGREAGTAAGQAQRAAAQWENFKTQLGAGLLPVITQVTSFLTSSVLPALQRNGDLVAWIAGGVVGLAAAVLAVNAAYKVFQAGQLIYQAIMKTGTAIQAAVTAAQWLMNAAMAANPIGLVVIAIAALVAGLIIAYKNSETFRNIVNAVWQFLKGAIRSAVSNIVGVIGWFARLPGMAAGWFGGFKDWAIRKAFELLGWLRGLPGRVRGAIGNLGNILWTAGRDLLYGLWNGISAASAWLRWKVRNFFGNILPGWAKNILGIASPSKLFRDEIGKQLLPGAVSGMESTMPAAMARVKLMTRRLADAAKSTTLTDMGSAAQELLGHITRGGRWFEDLSFRGGSDNLGRWNDVLSDRFYGSGLGIEDFLRQTIAAQTQQTGGTTEVRVFLGDQELRGMVRTEISHSNRDLRRNVRAGNGALA